jgi:hypothetical protein
MSTFIETLIKLPPPEKRRESIVPLRWLGPGLRLEGDADYLIYLLYKILLVIPGVLLTGLMICTYSTVDMAAVKPKNILNLVTFSQTLPCAAFALGVLFYLRMRLPMNIGTTHIPILIRQSALKDKPKERWILWISYLLVVFVLVLSFFHAIGRIQAWHVNAKETLIFMLLIQYPAILGIAAIIPLLASYVLLLEKTIRCFPEAQKDLMTIKQ